MFAEPLAQEETEEETLVIDGETTGLDYVKVQSSAASSSFISAWELERRCGELASNSVARYIECVHQRGRVSYPDSGLTRPHLSNLFRSADATSIALKSVIDTWFRKPAGETG